METGSAGGSDTPPLLDHDDTPFPDRTAPRLLLRAAERWGDKTLVRAGGGVERSYADTVDAVSARAGSLAAAGVGRGDRVAVLSANRLELLDVVLACGWMGAVAVPVNVESRGAQLAHILRNADPRLLVIEASRLANLDLVDEAPPALSAIWALDLDREAAPLGLPIESFPPPGAPHPPTAVRPGDTMAILYTSGTTGLSKGVCCPHAQFYWWGRLTARALDLGEDDVLHTTLPLFHTNALNAFFQALHAGGTYSLGERFSASRFWDQAREAGATVTYLLGAMVHILLKRPPSHSDRAHGIRTALSPATPHSDVEQFERRFGIRLVDGYGSTETNMVLANVVGDYRPGTMGRPLPVFEVQVVDDDDLPVPDGVPGELVVRHSEPFSIATGYFRMPEETAASWRNLWFHSGDRVVRDADGVFRFVDRMKDAIRRRGENVSSFEVEQVLLSHPEIQNAAVVPVPAEVGEEEVMAFVQPRADTSPEPVDLVRYCEPRLPSFAVPRYIELLPSLPLTDNGKVRKHVLRDRGVGPATWDRDREP